MNKQILIKTLLAKIAAARLTADERKDTLTRAVYIIDKRKPK